jgi:drug/metabolite transporter (DMT)-like permease
MLPTRTIGFRGHVPERVSQNRTISGPWIADQQISWRGRGRGASMLAVTRRAWIAFATVSVLWGVPYFFIKVAVDDVHPLFVAWSRIALGAAVLLPVAWRLGALRGVREHWRAVLAFSVIEIVFPFTAIPVGERFVSSSLAAIMIAAVPLTVAAMAARVDPSERPTGLRLAGLFVGLTGVVALVGIDVAGNPRELIGVGCMVIATLGYSAAPLIVRAKLSDLRPMGPVAASLGISTVLLAPAGLATLPDRMPPDKVIGSIVVLGVACTAIALAVMFALIAEAGPSRASVVTYINPVIAVVLGVVFLDERLGAGAIAGLLLILAGSWLATGGRPPGRRTQVAFESRADGLPRPSPS